MRLPIARLLVKAATWLAPRIKHEIADEVNRRIGGDLGGTGQKAGVPLEPLNPAYRRSSDSRPPGGPPG